MRLKDISIKFYPPVVVATLATAEGEENIEFYVPAGLNEAREIYDFLLQKNALFQMYKKETKHFSKQLAAAQASPSKFKLKSVFQPHFATISQVAYSREWQAFVSISADCSASVYNCVQRQNCQFELPSRPTCLAVEGGFIAIGFFSGCIRLYDAIGQELHSFGVQSVPVTLETVFEEDENYNLLAGLFDGRVVLVKVSAENEDYETEIHEIAKHNAPAVFAEPVSTHKFATAGLDGILAFEDTRRAASRLSAQSKATFFAKDSAVTAICQQARLLCIGFASGEWRGVEIGHQGFKMVFEGYEKRAISACALSCDGSITAIAVLGKTVVENNATGAKWEVDVPGEVRELTFLNPREEEKLLVAADRLLILNTVKKTREELECNKISYICASYDGRVIAVATSQGEVLIIEGE